MNTLIIADRVLTGAIEDMDDTALPPADAVLVSDDTIAAVGQADDLRRRTSGLDQELSFPGASITPGMINAHVHLCGDLSSEPFATVQSGDIAEIERLMWANARAALRGGCTTVRDLGDNYGLAFGLRDRISAGEEEGPRILAAGSPLTIPQGHCWFLGGEVANRTEMGERIDALAAAGADLIKVMAGGGQMTPSGPSMYESQFSASDLRFIVERARQHGLPVAAHAHGTRTIADCAGAGVSTIEHCSWWAERGRIELQDLTARRMAERSIAAGDTTPPQWRMLAELMPFPEGFKLGDQLPWLYSHGVPILIGTDSGLPNAVFDAFPVSLELYQERGFTTTHIIALATSLAADHLGLAEVTGRVEPGLAADLLVVSGDPRDDLTALGRHELIVAHGRMVGLSE